MRYGMSTAKVVFGVGLAYLGHFFATEAMVAWEWLGASAVFVVGLALAVHGLFTGIEASVTAGTA